MQPARHDDDDDDDNSNFCTVIGCQLTNINPKSAHSPGAVEYTYYMSADG